MISRKRRHWLGNVVSGHLISFLRNVCGTSHYLFALYGEMRRIPSISRLLSLVIALIIHVVTGRAEQRSFWRFWDAQDGLRESYTRTLAVSPNGTIWAVHGDVDKMSLIDGYGITMLPNLTRARVTVSGAGQAWARTERNVYLLQGDNWVSQPIPELAEHTSRFKDFEIVPLEKDCVLLLLPTRLLHYNGASQITTVVKQAGQTRLGRFNEIIRSSDGGVWVAGEHGVGKLSSITDEKSEWAEYVPDSLRMRDFRQP